MDKKAIRVCTMTDADKDDDLKGIPPGDLIGMMWQLALNAWSFRMSINVEPRLQRNVVVLARRKG